MKKLLALVMVCVALMTMAVATATAEYDIYTYGPGYNGVIVEIGQNPSNYIDTYISIRAGFEDTDVCVTIYGHPMRSESLSKVLEYFDVRNYWSLINNHLDYLKVLVELGLDEGNL